jgi:hypothetical protein
MRGARGTQGAHGTRRSRAAVGGAEVAAVRGEKISGRTHRLGRPAQRSASRSYQVQGGQKAVGAKRASGARDPVGGQQQGEGGVQQESGAAYALAKRLCVLGIPPEVTQRQRQAFTLGKRHDNNFC